MRVMVMVKNLPSGESEAREPEADLAMDRFNEQLINAGVLLAADGLRTSEHGARVRFEGTKWTVIDGPFTEAKELIAGFWIWQVRSLDEAIEWIRKAPFDGGREIELRPLHEADDFGSEPAPDRAAVTSRSS